MIAGLFRQGLDTQSDAAASRDPPHAWHDCRVYQMSCSFSQALCRCAQALTIFLACLRATVPARARADTGTCAHATRARAGGALEGGRGLGLHARPRSPPPPPGMRACALVQARTSARAHARAHWRGDSRAVSGGCTHANTRAQALTPSNKRTCAGATRYSSFSWKTGSRCDNRDSCLLCPQVIW